MKVRKKKKGIISTIYRSFIENGYNKHDARRQTKDLIVFTRKQEVRE